MTGIIVYAVNINDRVMTEEEFDTLPEWNGAAEKPAGRKVPPPGSVMTEEEFDALPDIPTEVSGVQDFSVVRRAIAEDNPLLLVPPERTAAVNSYLREDEQTPALAVRVARKAAVSQYLAKEFRLPAGEVAAEYFNQLSRRYFGEELDVNAAWNRIREIEAERNAPDQAARHRQDLETGLYAATKTINDMTATTAMAAEKGLGWLNTGFYRPLAKLAEVSGFPGTAEFLNRQTAAPVAVSELTRVLKENSRDARRELEIMNRERPTPESFEEEVAMGVITTLPFVFVVFIVFVVLAIWDFFHSEIPYNKKNENENEPEKEYEIPEEESENLLLETWKLLTNRQQFFLGLNFVGTCFLLLALCYNFSQGFYMFLRIVVSLSFVGLLLDRFASWVKIILVLGLILYNPIFPIHLGSSNIWKIFNSLTVLILWIIWVVLLRKIKSSETSPKLH